MRVARKLAAYSVYVRREEAGRLLRKIFLIEDIRGSKFLFKVHLKRGITHLLKVNAIHSSRGLQARRACWHQT